MPSPLLCLVRFLAILVLLTSNVGCGGKGGSGGSATGPEGLYAERVRLLKEMATILQAVKNDASGARAAAELKGAAGRFAENEKKIRDLKLSKEEAAQWSAKHENDINQARKDLGQAMALATNEAPDHSVAIVDLIDPILVSLRPTSVERPKK